MIAQIKKHTIGIYLIGTTEGHFAQLDTAQAALDFCVSLGYNIIEWDVQ